MSNIVFLKTKRDTVQETIDELLLVQPDAMLVFFGKGDEYYVLHSNIEDFTMMLGALEYMKSKLMLNQLLDLEL